MSIRSKSDLADHYDLMSTIYHESGHVIYILLNLLKVRKVYVYQNEEKRSEGFTYYNLPDASSFSNTGILLFIMNLEICIKYAGLIAEKYHFKTISGCNKFPIFLRDGSSDDILSVTKIFKQYNFVPSGKKRYLYKKKLIKSTLDKLQLQWDDVVLIAHKLFQKRKLSFQYLKKILTTKSENKEFWKNQFKIIEFINKNCSKIDEKKYSLILTKCGLI